MSAATSNPTPSPWPLYRALVVVACAPVLPQILGSIFNIWYNATVIGPLLNTPLLRERFTETVVVFNIVVYPIAVGAWIWIVCSLFPAMWAVWSGAATVDSSRLDRARRWVINLPWIGAALAGICWLVGIPIFLGALIATGDPIKSELYVHLPISFLVSTLISITHSFFLIEMCSHRLLLPVLFRNTDAHAISGTWKLTLRGRGLLWVLSAAICPISSLLLLSFAPVNPSMNPQWFALFVGSVGIAFGLCTALMIGRLVGEPIDLLSGAVRDVAAGKFDIQMVHQRPDEFGLLISEFNRMIRELREKENLRETFGFHVGRRAAEQILAHDPGLSGALETITVMFCDIRNFTPRCARQTPERTVRLLNDFFGVMVRIVEENNGGMINQFTGDGFMAFFGAYGNPAQHAEAALKAGNDMLTALKDFNATMREQEPDFEPLAIGIGLHTGPAVVGTVGSPRRMTFTAIGSTVNVAARVESLTKLLGHPLILTRATRDALAQPPPLLELPAQQVKGVEHPLAVFAPQQLQL
jgi:adenylate cyclase